MYNTRDDSRLLLKTMFNRTHRHVTHEKEFTRTGLKLAYSLRMRQYRCYGGKFDTFYSI